MIQRVRRHQNEASEQLVKFSDGMHTADSQNNGVGKPDWAATTNESGMEELIFRYGSVRWLGHFLAAVPFGLLVVAGESFFPGGGILWIGGAIGVVSIGSGIVSELRAPRMVILRRDTLSLLWRGRQHSVALVELTISEGKLALYPSRRIRLIYGKNRAEIRNNLLGYRKLLNELLARGVKIEGRLLTIVETEQLPDQ